ncbi:uncharacterized protein B0I36DRAFT_413869 [Microdochium trichocladiopsis]|uniref:Thioesterase domain-containing protein n=1 Tax=Microdochium trichocladiopsis TaxID=1682393 RepID=A0A9P9BMB4_9PEZI|nr:uncharacterized protein B0I36DRAFT_413869 [Microdochium trichocladiopsis]KAH7025661.1 hypothetical protein B0I36DRAFT_413869 [Microdochium trichocladiopsis]
MTFLDRHPALTPQDEAFLAANPWIAKLYYDQARAVPFSPGSRHVEPTPPVIALYERLFSRTLRDSGAVPLCLAWHAPLDFESAEAAVAEQDAAEADRADKKEVEQKEGEIYLIPEITMAFDLGEGMRGYHGVAHGGIFGLLIDECVGNYLALNQATSYTVEQGAFGQQKAQSLSKRLCGLGGTTAFTVGMDVRFFRKIDVPAAVVVRTWLGGYTGRIAGEDATHTCYDAIATFTVYVL